MKELQKYYAENPMSLAIDYIGPYYDASEADAAFAEMRREHEADLASNNLMHAREIEALKREHAEEIERLKSNIDNWCRKAESAANALERAQLQAERYEKLKPLISGKEYRRIGIVYSQPSQIDSLVDQLPSSGEASADEQARRTE